MTPCSGMSCLSECKISTFPTIGATLTVSALPRRSHARPPHPARVAAHRGTRSSRRSFAFVRRRAPKMHRPARVVGSASTAKPALKALNLDDYGGWNRIGTTALSRDGKWMTFTYTPNEGGDPVLHVKALDGDKDYTVIPRRGGRRRRWTRGGGGRGAAAGGGEWRTVVFRRFSLGGVLGESALGAPAAVPAADGRTGARRAAASAQGGQPQTPATRGHLELLNLATGEKSSIPNAGSWKFSPGSKWIAVRFNRPQAAAAGAGGAAHVAAAPASNGADLILRDLTTGADHAIGNVNQYEFDDDGQTLRLHRRRRREVRQRRVRARSGDRRDARAQHRRRDLRRAHVER